MGIKTEFVCSGLKHKRKNCIQSCMHAFGQKDLSWKPINMDTFSEFGKEVDPDSKNQNNRITDENGRVDKKSEQFRIR